MSIVKTPKVKAAIRTRKRVEEALRDGRLPLRVEPVKSTVFSLDEEIAKIINKFEELRGLKSNPQVFRKTFLRFLESVGALYDILKSEAIKEDREIPTDLLKQLERLNDIASNITEEDGAQEKVLTKRLDEGRRECEDCGQKDCQCFAYLSAPSIVAKGGCLEIIFGADWSRLDKDNYLKSRGLKKCR